MKVIQLREMTNDQLVERFADIALQQDDVLLANEIARFNKLYQQMDAVDKELN